MILGSRQTTARSSRAISQFAASQWRQTTRVQLRVLLSYIVLGVGARLLWESDVGEYFGCFHPEEASSSGDQGWSWWPFGPICRFSFGEVESRGPGIVSSALSMLWVLVATYLLALLILRPFVRRGFGLSGMIMQFLTSRATDETSLTIRAMRNRPGLEHSTFIPAVRVEGFRSWRRWKDGVGLARFLSDDSLEFVGSDGTRFELTSLSSYRLFGGTAVRGEPKSAPTIQFRPREKGRLPAHV